jgi:acetoin utilization protein AcuB
MNSSSVKERMDNAHTLLPYFSIGTRAIAAHQPVSMALQIMDEHKLRHLPVMKDGVVVGEVSDRDLRVWSKQVAAAAETPVSQIMVEEPFVISSKASLEEVASAMAARKIGCAIVVDEGHLVGMFTVTDALKALAQLASR